MSFTWNLSICLCWLLFILLFFYTSRYSPLAGFVSNGCFTDDPEKIQALARFRLPAGAKLLETECQGLQGWYAAAKFEMNPGDLNTFIRSKSIKTNFQTKTDMSKLNWAVQKVIKNNIPTSYLHSKVDFPEFLQEVLIDTSDPNRYTVYIGVLVG
jgi:hypothetical protein